MLFFSSTTSGVAAGVVIILVPPTQLSAFLGDLFTKPLIIHLYRLDYLFFLQFSILNAWRAYLAESCIAERLSDTSYIVSQDRFGQLAELDRPTVAAAIREIRVYEGNRMEIDYLLPEGCRALLEG